MKNVYLKSSFREINSSKGKFISIILIILLGTLIFVGVRSTGPDLSNSASTYVNKYNLYDLQIVSTMGLTEDDMQVLNDEEDLVVEPGFSTIFEKNKDEIVQILSYSEDSQLNKLKVIEGDLPTSNKEIVIDIKAKELGYKLGDEYKTNSAVIKNSAYTIVGFVNSPLYISTSDRGTTNSGNGNIRYFAYIPQESFAQEVYSQLFIKFSNTENLVANSSEYTRAIDKNILKIEKLFAERPQNRLNEIKANAKETLNINLQEIQKGKQQIEAATKMPIGADLPSLNEESEKLEKLQNEIKTKLSEIEAMEKPVYYFNTRSTIPGYQDYFDSATSIAAIAGIFPAFFLFIAVLVTFTTMSRMVEENRGEIGTLKALGYSKLEIAQKYIIYTLLAGLLGVGLGTIIGTETLPLFIFNILKDHNIPTFVGQYHWNYIIPALFAGLFATLGSALYVLWKDLREKPAMLMRPRAPKSGKRIFLERVTPIWDRLNFNQKVSYRNLFRYKSRMIMAIVGIAGCTGLILTGYGIKNSTEDLKPKQFNEILHYQGIVTMDQAETLIDNSQITDDMSAVVESLSVENEKNVSQTVSMISPSTPKSFNKYVTLHDVEDRKEIILTNSGAVITEKLAEDMNVDIGGTLYIKRDNKKIKCKVKGIAENYLGHFIYMSPSYYRELFGENYSPTSVLIKTKKMTATEQEKLTSNLLENDDVKNVTFFQESGGVEQFGSLNSVVIILIVLSGALALVVLYNLTNINISERIRELSTIKVLGFYNKEVTAYVMRENVVLSVLGILFGFFIGSYLHKFILTTAESGNIVFPLDIHWDSFVYAGLITMVFNFLVIGIAHFKLKHINMIDALKSNE